MAARRNRRRKNTKAAKMAARPATTQPTLIPAMAPLLSPEPPDVSLESLELELVAVGFVVELEEHTSPRH